MKPTEQKILDYIKTHPDTEHSSSEIQVSLTIGQANCSRYLNNLVKGNYLSRRKVGKQVFYSLYKSTVEKIPKLGKKPKVDKLPEDISLLDEIKKRVDTKIYSTSYLGPTKTFDLPIPLVSEIIDDLKENDRLRGHNLTPKKYNIKPLVDILEAVIRIQKRKLAEV